MESAPTVNWVNSRLRWRYFKRYLLIHRLGGPPSPSREGLGYTAAVEQMVTTIPVGVDVLGDPCTNNSTKINGGRGNPSPTDDLGNPTATVEIF